jgi:DNA-binding PadR family transcriptional regulator
MEHEPFSKDLTTGAYDLVALDILSEGPTYVYGMIRKIHEQSGKLFGWREGTAYRVLHDLERRGLAASTWIGPKGGRRRKYYRITDHGRREWKQQRREWAMFRRALDALLRAR